MLGIRAQILGIRVQIAAPRVQIAAPRVLGCAARRAARAHSEASVGGNSLSANGISVLHGGGGSGSGPCGSQAQDAQHGPGGGRRAAGDRCGYMRVCLRVCACVRVAAETPASLRELLQPLLARVVARCRIPAVGVAGSWRRCDGSGQTWPRRKGAYELLDGFSAAPSADASCRAAGACVSERSSVRTGTCLCVCASV